MHGVVLQIILHNNLNDAFNNDSILYMVITKYMTEGQKYRLTLYVITEWLQPRGYNVCL